MASFGWTPEGQFKINGAARTFSSYNAYNLISGSFTLGGAVQTNGMATTPYTGNGTTQSVVTGVDMATQWGNNASETFGGLVIPKGRSFISDFQWVDTVRGATKNIRTNGTDAEYTDVNGLTAFTSTGFNIGSGAGVNQNTSTYVSWNFQTTHRKTSVSNHGKTITEHYNPFTGFTIIKYEGSGLAGHEITHSLGRKLGFVVTKNLSAIADWTTAYRENNLLQLNTTIAETASGNGFSGITDTVTTLASSASNINTSTNQYIMYGWANSYFDEANTLIGNYEVGIYQGTGAAGNKVTTRGKPAWVMIKRLDSTGSWEIYDNKRTGTYSPVLWPNQSAAEVSDVNRNFIFNSDGFTISDTFADNNASGGQYLYMVVYDNDSGSGKSKYPRATDTSALNLNAVIPFANGLDNNGTKNTVLTKNETVSGLTLTQGKNYVYAKNDGTYGVSKALPQYHTYNGFGDYYDVTTNKWYQSPSVFSDDFSTDTGWTLGSATQVTSSGTITITATGANGGAVRSLTMVAGKQYRIKVKINSVTSADTFIQFNSTTGFQYLPTAGEYTVDFTAVGGVASTGIKIGTTSAKTVVDYFAIYPINNDGSVDITSATPITESRNYLDAIVYADAGGQPTYIEQLPKIEYKDVVKANEYQGKNACTAWVNFDGTTTPPTIRDSFNVSAVIRVATGDFDVYYKEPMDNMNCCGSVTTNSQDGLIQFNSLLKARVVTYATSTGANGNYSGVYVQIFGGKNA